MRVLLTHRPGGAYGYISEAWLNTLNSVGFAAQRWDGQKQSWDAFGPDLYIGCSGHQQPLPGRRGKTKVAIHCNPLAIDGLGAINEPRNAADWVAAQRPDAVFGYGTPDVAYLWANWHKRLGIRWVPMATAGDITQYKKIGTNDAVDFAYLGGRWTYKAESIDRFLLPLFETPLSYKLAGWGEWPAPLKANRLPDGEENTFYSEAKVAPCISEPHTYTWRIDLPERVFKAILSGCVAIHDAADIVGSILPAVPVAKTPPEFVALVTYWSSVPAAKRLRLAEEQRQQVLAGHTYNHRLAGLFTALGFEQQAKILTDSVLDQTQVS